MRLLGGRLSPRRTKHYYGYLFYCRYLAPKLSNYEPYFLKLTGEQRLWMSKTLLQIPIFEVR
jgi:hypothetical protein